MQVQSNSTFSVMCKYSKISYYVPFASPYFLAAGESHLMVSFKVMFFERVYFFPGKCGSEKAK